MGHHHLAEAAVIGLPEGLADAQVGLPGAGIEAGVGGDPAPAWIEAGQVFQALLPAAAGAVAQLTVGVASRQGPLGVPVVAVEGVHQIGLVVAPQPHHPAAAHLAPHQLHRLEDLGPAVDHVAVEDQPVFRGQQLQQAPQGLRASMNVPDDPVTGGTDWGRHRTGAMA